MTGPTALFANCSNSEPHNRQPPPRPSQNPPRLRGPPRASKPKNCETNLRHPRTLRLKFTSAHPWGRFPTRFPTCPAPRKLKIRRIMKDNYLLNPSASGRRQDSLPSFHPALIRQLNNFFTATWSHAKLKSMKLLTLLYHPNRTGSYGQTGFMNKLHWTLALIAACCSLADAQQAAPVGLPGLSAPPTQPATSVTVSAPPGRGDPFQGSVPTGEATPGILPLSLDEAISRGLKYNLGVITSDQDIRISRASRLRALSQLLPN